MATMDGYVRVSHRGDREGDSYRSPSSSRSDGLTRPQGRSDWPPLFRAGPRYPQVTMALTPGERVTLTKRIGETLMAQSFSDLDLVMDTFKAPESFRPDEAWDGEKYDYVLRRLRDSRDEILVGLHAHLYPDVSMEAAAAGAVGPWRDGHFRLFLSHTNANKKLAAQIRELLLGYGIDTFVAHDMIEPTKEWMDEIETALGTCDGLVALLTEDFVTSKWCDQEIGFAVARGVLIVAVRQGADPHGFISKYQAVPGDATTLAAHTIARGIFDTLIANPMTNPKMSPALVHSYANSGSFDDARANLQRVMNIPQEHWTDEMVELTEKAGEENSQLYHGIWNYQRIPVVLTAHLDELLERESAAAAEGVPAPASDDDIPF